MTLLWVRPVHAEQHFTPEERRLRDYLDNRGGMSESVDSLSAKLQLRRGQCRRLLDQLVKEGVVNRREFGDIQPIYYRYPNR